VLCTTRSSLLLCVLWGKSYKKLTAVEGKYLRRIIKRRALQLKLQLPIKDVAVGLPRLGSDHWKNHLKHGFDKLLTHMFATGAVQLSAFLPSFRETSAAPKIQIKWHSSSSVFDEVRNAGFHNSRSFPASPLDLAPCKCSHDVCAGQPIVMCRDGMLQVCARQSEIV
jgi:hypothetical protein